MGQLCGKQKHFESVRRVRLTEPKLMRESRGEGQRLGSAPPSRPPSGQQSHVLGGGAPASARGTGAGAGAGAGGREAAAAAAEARAKASAQRGATTKPVGGGLSDQLARQKRDGGRVEEAIGAGARRGDEPLRVRPTCPP